jgi:hypothetical protein
MLAPLFDRADLQSFGFSVADPMLGGLFNGLADARGCVGALLDLMQGLDLPGLIERELTESHFSKSAKEFVRKTRGEIVR